MLQVLNAFDKPANKHEVKPASKDTHWVIQTNKDVHDQTALYAYNYKKLISLQVLIVAEEWKRKAGRVLKSLPQG